MMKIIIDLLYFDGCPNTDDARSNLKKALTRLSMPIRWNEVDLKAPNTPEHLKGFPSPSILVNGIDVETGLSELQGSSCCKVGGVPSETTIFSALKSNPPKKGALAFFAALPATMIAVFPSVFCPACYPALAALLSSMGLGFFAGEAVIRPLTIIFLSLALIGLFYQSYKLKKYGSFVVGLVGAFGIYVGHYVFPSLIITYGAVVLLIGASIWNLINKKKKLKTEGASCPSC